MVFPGFSISDNIVGKSVSFDTIRLEEYGELQHHWEGDLPPQVRLTSEAQDAIKCVLDKYYQRYPELRDWYPPGSTSFKFPVREADIDPLLNCLAHCIVLRLTPGAPSEFSSSEPRTLLYSEFLIDDLDYSINPPDWSQLDDSEMNVQAEIENQIPDGYDSIELTQEKFREYVYDVLRPIATESDWPEGAAWSINLALHELRKGRYQEAAYAFAAVRNSVTKSPTPVEETDYTQLLNKYLITLRDLSLHHSTAEAPSVSQERFVDISDRTYIFVPTFISEPTFHDPYFRMSSPIWIANALTFISGLAHALAAPTISRNEIDPFGSEMTFNNTSFVLRAANELVGIDERTNQEDPVGYLDYIDFREFAPEAVLTDVFESIGYETVGTFESSFEYEGIEVSLDADLVLEKDSKLHLVYYNPSDVQSLHQEVEQLDIEALLLIVAEEEYTETIIDSARNSETIELYYLDVGSTTLRSVDTGLPVRSQAPVTKSEVQERLRDLYDSANTVDNPQQKGDLLEQFAELLFKRYISETEVLRVNSETGSEEFDLVLRNNQESDPWENLSSIIMVECKNWSGSVGANVIHTLNSKADTLGANCTTGILLSWNGISGSEYEDAAHQRIRELKQQGFEVLHFDKSSMESMIESDTPNEIFDQRYIELITEY
ncbi:restriction endonuclease [Haloarcula sp. JP-Z28]|uniref:restriction endonuclease n=1 Tax=unclassified Haloarcula TaxID=2624677 RepID=UPI0013140D0C|nr:MULTISPECIES: restriction endonuclease [unclassified Haloarcula]NHN63674.1 restriction endonuclease [Haloarcula sp. JP-Z28]